MNAPNALHDRMLAHNSLICLSENIHTVTFHQNYLVPLRHAAQSESAGANHQRYVYENSADFQALPSFGIIAAFRATDAVPFHSILPNYDYVRIFSYILRLSH